MAEERAQAFAVEKGISFASAGGRQCLEDRASDNFRPHLENLPGFLQRSVDLRVPLRRPTRADAGLECQATHDAAPDVLALGQHVIGMPARSAAIPGIIAVVMLALRLPSGVDADRGVGNP